jgi:hypothetical protein
MGPNDGDIEGDWPFGENVFHIFIRQEENAFTYKYVWG